MDKGFNLNIDMLFNRRDFLQTRLASKYNPRQSFILPELHGLPIQRGLLCAQMNFELGAARLATSIIAGSAAMIAAMPASSKLRR